MTELLRAAFAALGHGPLEVDKLELVAGALLASGDAETLALFDGEEAGYKGPGYRAVVEIAESMPESDAFKALELFTEVCNPGAHRRVLERGRLSERGRAEQWLAEAACRAESQPRGAP
jgi:hypothetical protein